MNQYHTEPLDRIWNGFNRIRGLMLTNFYNSPDAFVKDFWKIFPRDDYCQTKVGKVSNIPECLSGKSYCNIAVNPNEYDLTKYDPKEEHRKKIYQCQMCYLLLRISTLKSLSEKMPFSLEVTDVKGKPFHLVYSSSEPQTQSNKLSLNLWYEVDEKNLIFRTTSYINQIMMQWFLEPLFYYYKIGHFSDYIPLAFICGNDNYYVEEYFTPRNIVIDANNLWSILVQVIIFLHILRTSDWIHPELILNSFYFIEIPYNFSYDGEIIQTNVIIKMKPVSGMAVTFGKYRFATIIPNYPVKPSISERKMVDPTTSQTYEIFSIEEKDYRDVLKSRQHGDMSISNSLDLYNLMVTLMLTPSLAQVVKETPKLLDLWKLLWSPGDYDEITRRIGKSKRVESIIDNIYMRKDAVEKIWLYIKNEFKKEQKFEIKLDGNGKEKTT